MAAAFVALLAWAGLAIQFNATLAATGSVAETLWILGRFFTILTNLLVALTFSVLAVGKTVSPFWLGGVTLAIVLVGIIYMLLLRGLLELSGGALLADAILHKVVPVVIPLFWLAFAPKGRLKSSAPLLWTLYPVAYLAYAMARGAAEGAYAYPFIDAGSLGIAQVAINVAAIGVGFVAAGFGFVMLDRSLGANQRPLRR
jgi:hypothetical protein